MSNATNDPIAQAANTAIEQAKRGCVDRGVGFDGKPLNPCHVYLEGAVKCQCGKGPELEVIAAGADEDSHRH